MSQSIPQSLFNGFPHMGRDVKRGVAGLSRNTLRPLACCSSRPVAHLDYGTEGYWSIMLVIFLSSFMTLT